MSPEVAKALIGWEDHPEAKNYKAVTDDKMVERSRWSTFYEQVYRNLTDDTYWEIYWSRGSTEYQDNGVEDITITQVKPRQKVVTIYERI